MATSLQRPAHPALASITDSKLPFLTQDEVESFGGITTAGGKKEPAIIGMVGGIGVGKSTFCTALINVAEKTEGEICPAGTKPNGSAFTDQIMDWRLGFEGRPSMVVLRDIPGERMSNNGDYNEVLSFKVIGTSATGQRSTDGVERRGSDGVVIFVNGKTVKKTVEALPERAEKSLPEREAVELARSNDIPFIVVVTHLDQYQHADQFFCTSKVIEAQKEVADLLCVSPNDVFPVNNSPWIEAKSLFECTKMNAVANLLRRIEARRRVGVCYDD